MNEKGGGLSNMKNFSTDFNASMMNFGVNASLEYFKEKRHSICRLDQVDTVSKTYKTQGGAKKNRFTSTGLNNQHSVQKHLTKDG